MKYRSTKLLPFTLFFLLVVHTPLIAEPAVFELISVGMNGAEKYDNSYASSISWGGRFVVFSSRAENLVPDDSNLKQDVYVRDREKNETTRVSIPTGGSQGNGDSFGGAISSDGQYVAFYSEATNLVENDTNGREDVFVHDRQSGQTTRVNVDSSGNQAQGGDSWVNTISANGRIVVFSSWAPNLVANDTRGMLDIFTHDRKNGETSRINVSSAGEEANKWSAHPSISSDGRYIVFESEATNLVVNDTNEKTDVFIHDRHSGQTTRISVHLNGAEGNGASHSPQIAEDGSKVVFVSEATNLVSGDTNGLADIFLHDLETETTVRASLSANGEQAEGPSGSRSPYVSANGRYVAFQSSAVNLVDNDTNGRNDTFVKDMDNGTVLRPLPGQGQFGFSSDGRFILFDTVAKISENDQDKSLDVYVYGPLFDMPKQGTAFSPVSQGMIELLLLSQDVPAVH